MAPRVSVVIPTFNRSGLLARAIDSVLAQERPPDEVIVVDDRSTDDTPEVLAGYGDAIFAIRMERNSERGACRNTGLEAAGGELVAFLDSDDEWEPEKLARQLDRRNGAPASVTGIRMIDQDGTPTGAAYVPVPGDQRRLFVNNVFLGSPSTLLIDRDVALGVGGFPTNRVLQGSEDWVFLVELTLAGHSIRIVPEPLVRYRVHPGGSTARAANLARSMWWASDWMDRADLATASVRGERRSRVAAAVATAYLAERRPRQALPWARRALANGGPRARAYSAWRILRTAGRTALRRAPRMQ